MSEWVRCVLSCCHLPEARRSRAAAAGEWSPSETARAPITLEGKTATTATISPNNPTANPTPTNPFLPFKHPVTGKWQDPVYSLRRQADLVKLARQHNVDGLLPPTVKSEAAKEAKFLEGKKMRRVHEPKGHKYEKVVQERYGRFLSFFLIRLLCWEV